jgi:hypothetical protein
MIEANRIRCLTSGPAIADEFAVPNSEGVTGYVVLRRQLGERL